jgi:hypothetical protein
MHGVSRARDAPASGTFGLGGERRLQVLDVLVGIGQQLSVQ